MKSFVLLLVLALGAVEAFRPKASMPWLKIARAQRAKSVALNATKPLIGMPDGHELSPLHRQHLPAWNQYKKRYARVYDSFEEEMRRFAIFIENLRLVNEHNEQRKASKDSYELSANQYADMTNSEFVARFNGLRINTESKGRSLLHRSPVKVADLPDSVDWRTQGYVTPIKNQLHCGSCWSFSTTGALEGRWFAKSGKLISLSEQQLVDCSANWGNNGCNGGLMDNAFQYIKDIGGLETESSYPYTGRAGKCQFNQSAVVAHDTGFTDVAADDESALQEAVATVGPVSVAIDASLSSFQLYHQGVYSDPKCSSTKLDHGVLVVGYGTDSQSGEQYWIIKNSWGTGWGMDGYMFLARNQDNKCGVASSASYPTV